MKKFKLNDLFCGCGGMGLGFKNAGFEMVGAFDFDKYAVKTYAKNIGDHVREVDISKMKWSDIPDSDVWTFGFPCQDLSNAGKQAGMKLKCMKCDNEWRVTNPGESICNKCGSDNTKAASRSGLFFEVIRLLEETSENDINRLPSIIVAENVKRLKPLLGVLESEYKKVGYNMYYALYDSKYWGVPQHRDRYFVVGVHESIKVEFVFPVQQEKYVPRLSTILENVVDEKYYISEEKTIGIIQQVKDKLRVKEATKKGYAEAVVGDAINIAHPNSKTRRGRVGKQLAQTILTSCEQVVMEQPKIINLGNTNPSGKGMNGNVIHQDGLSSTLTTNKGEGIKVGVNTIKNGKEFHSMAEQSVTCCARDYKGPSGAQPFTMATDGFRVRKLTPRECARLQGFPESFEIVVSDSQAYKQFGNAVTVNVSQAIAERIKMFLLSL